MLWTVRQVWGDKFKRIDASVNSESMRLHPEKGKLQGSTPLNSMRPEEARVSSTHDDHLEDIKSMHRV